MQKVDKIENLSRYDIVYANLPQNIGSHVQYGFRPVVILSNNLANLYSPVVTVAPLTSKPKKTLPTHVQLNGGGLTRESTVLCEQVMAVDKQDLARKIGTVNRSADRAAINRALAVQLGLAA